MFSLTVRGFAVLGLVWVGFDGDFRAGGVLEFARSWILSRFPLLIRRERHEAEVDERIGLFSLFQISRRSR